MSPWLGLALGGAGALIACLREGRVRTAGVLVLLAGGAVSLSTAVGIRGAAAWLAGPSVAALLLSSAAASRMPFDALARRSAIGAGGLALALIAAARLPMGELSFAAIAPAWLVTAVGLGWVLAYRDRREFARGAMLVISGGGAVLLLASSSSGPLTAGLVGLLGLVPLLAERRPEPIGQAESMLAPAWLLFALLAAGAALSGWNPSIRLGDLTLGFRGMAGPGLVITFLAAAAIRPAGLSWAAAPAALSLLATSTALRWVALAAVLAVCTVPKRPPAMMPWLGLSALGLAGVLPAVSPAAPYYRAQAVFLAGGLLLLALAARDLRIRALAITPVVVYAFEIAQHLPNPGQTRFQLVSLASAACLMILVVKGWPRAGREERYALRDALTLALALLAVAASSPLATVAVSLLLVEIAIVSPARARPPVGPEWLEILAHSGWPPAIGFAARVLAVIATLQQSIPLGMAAIALVAALQLTPLIERRATRPRPASVRSWQLLVPLTSLLFGLAPEILRRMVKL